MSSLRRLPNSPYYIVCGNGVTSRHSTFGSDCLHEMSNVGMRPHWNFAATDQRGVTRPAMVRCDIGAYEFRPESFIFASISTGVGPNVILQGTGVPDQTFRLQAASNLFGDWKDIASGTVSPSGRFQITTGLRQWGHFTVCGNGVTSRHSTFGSDCLHEMSNVGMRPHWNFEHHRQ